MEHSLLVYHNRELIFYSDEKWLHPLLDLEAFLKRNHFNPQHLLVHDKIVGRAAALLIARLKIGRVKAEKLSIAGQAALEHFNIPYTYQELLNHVACETEKILLDELDPEKAHQLILGRITRKLYGAN
jgi:hypothetical protein